MSSWCRGSRWGGGSGGLKNACCCCAPSQLPLGGARRPPHREAQAFGRPWLYRRGLAWRPSEGCGKKLPAAAQWSCSLKQRGLRGQWGSHGYQEPWKGQGEEGAEGMACTPRDRGSPPDFPQSWRGEEDPRSFSLSLACQPLRIYGICSEATGINIRGGLKSPKSAQEQKIQELANVCASVSFSPRICRSLYPLPL